MLVSNDCSRAISRNAIDDICSQPRCNSKVQSRWESIPPARDENISWTPQAGTNILVMLVWTLELHPGTQKARALQLRVEARRVEPKEDRATQEVMPPGTVAVARAHQSMVAKSIHALCAKRAERRRRGDLMP